jgi:hypothetical protein
MIEIKRDLRQGILGFDFGGNHSKVQKISDVAALLSKNLAKSIYTKRPGRGFTDEYTDIVKPAVDWMQVGLRTLGDGKYWETFVRRTVGVSQGNRDIGEDDQELVDDELMHMEVLE